MTEIRIKKLTFHYFKGLIDKEINFNGLNVNICGRNETGKTTIADGWNWLLFGKDSDGKTDFEVKTLNPDNTIIDGVDHIVEGDLVVNGIDITLKRVLHEKWEKKRGTNFTVFTGNETLCFYDGVPLSITEYTARINKILDESQFKLVTNPMYFNVILKWQQRREILAKMAGDVTNDQIFDKLITVSNKQQYIELINLLNQGKSLSDIKAKASADRKRIKDQLDQIPPRIDELKRNIPVVQNWEEIEKEISNVNHEINLINENISGKVSSKESLLKTKHERTERIQALKTEQSSIVFSHNSQAQEEANKKNTARQELIQKRTQLITQKSGVSSDIGSKNDFLSSKSRHLSMLKERRDQLRKDWEEENSKELGLSLDGITCPIYKIKCADQEANKLFSKDQESSITRFNEGKKNNLDKINENGIELSKQIEVVEKEISDLEIEVIQLSKQLKSLEEEFESVDRKISLTPVVGADLIDFSSVTEWQEIQLEIEKLELVVDETVDTSIYESSRKEKENELYELKKSLDTKEQIERTNQRIHQLNEESNRLAQEQSNIECLEFLVQEFTKCKMDEVEKRVNGNFKYVKFKMFDKQINGSEVECCEALINGVPFSSANNAAKINAGIDIINAVGCFYGINVPIFVDNAESINEILVTPSQLIRLVVSFDEKLTVN